jgi:hypothetical protein
MRFDLANLAHSSLFFVNVGLFVGHTNLPEHVHVFLFTHGSINSCVYIYMYIGKERQAHIVYLIKPFS